MSTIQPGAAPEGVGWALLLLIYQGARAPESGVAFFTHLAPFLPDGVGKGRKMYSWPEAFFSAALRKAVVVGVTPGKAEDDSLGGHSESKTPEYVKKPHCAQNHSTSAKAFVTVVPKPGCTAELSRAISHTGV